jgi:glycosyltransferase involved in cell wall biosynthesis
MPFLNTPEKFFREAVDSVVRQTHEDWELLLIDDGSTPEISLVARELAESDPARIQYFQHDPPGTRGSSRSRNLAISHARGEFVAFLDADDVWLPGKLEEQLQILSQHPDIGMLIGNTLYWYGWTGDPDDRRRDHMPRLGTRPITILEPPRMLHYSLQGRIPVPCMCSIICRRKLQAEGNWFEDQFVGMYDDQVFYAKFWTIAPVCIVDRCWDRYRQHPASMTANGDKAKEHSATRRKYLDWIDKYVDSLQIHDAGLERALAFEKFIARWGHAASFFRKARRLFWQAMPSLR